MGVFSSNSATYTFDSINSSTPVAPNGLVEAALLMAGATKKAREADLAKAMMSLPATKGFEIGSGFAGTTLTGSEHNDAFYMDGDRVRTVTNRSGGIQGGISNGEDIIIRIAFKPTATIRKEQNTVTRDGLDVTLSAKGRHDPCVLPRAVPMVEAMAALVLCDHLLRQRAQCGENFLHQRH